MLQWTRRQGFRIEGGQGAQYATLYFLLDLEGTETKPLYLYEGYVAPVLHFQFDEMGAGFRGQDKRRELADKVNQIKGANLSPEKSYPSLSFGLIRESKEEAALMEALDWLVGDLKGTIS